MKAKRPGWQVFGSIDPDKTQAVRRRRPVYLRLGDSWVRVRTFEGDGKGSFVGTVDSIASGAPEGIHAGDWVEFDSRHIFSVCVSHE